MWSFWKSLANSWRRSPPADGRAAAAQHSDEPSRPAANDGEQESPLPTVPLNWSSGDGSNGHGSSGWGQRGAWALVLSQSRGSITAEVACDPLRRERICLSTLACWRRRSAQTRGSQRERAAPPTPVELFELFSGMLGTIAAAGLTPTVVLTEPDAQLESWQGWLARHAPRLTPHQRQTMTRKQWRLLEVSPFLDRQPYGLDLATRLAASLRSTGHQLSYGHRDYCGQGLRAAEGSYRLERYEDGLPSGLLASWQDERSFIAAVASWSDYICSGCDPDASIFAAESEFELSNQRITRERIQAYLSTPAP